ncbi:MAG: GH3 auxin-responsive promoter family protein [Opitutaceae bacterium]|nr:GH3 auxin-responsive promoter family protein [Opitutaceae bacterium]
MNGLLTMPLRVGARLLAARTRRAMTRPRAAAGNQARILRQLLRGYARSRHGRMHALDASMSYEEYCACVPLRTYEDFAPIIERVRMGARDELWPGPCRHLALSSGTTAGPSKFLPVNAPMLEHFRQAGLQSLLLHTARTGRADLFEGRHLLLGGATALQRVSPETSAEVLAGDLSGITAMHLPRWVDALLYEPGSTIAQIEDWPQKIAAIVERTISRDVRLVAGIPSWLLVLFEALQRRALAGGGTWIDLRSIWPRLTCLVHGGVPIDPYIGQLRAFTGPGVDFHEVFPASEAFIAAQDGATGEGLRLLDGVGVFYEFVPLDQLDSDGRPRPGACAVALEQAAPDVDYALALSNPGGLCRYLIGDIVRLLSIDPPRLLYRGRTRLQLSAFGEHVLEHELTRAIAQVAAREEIQVAHFHVAPLFAASGRAGAPGRGAHEWWIELAGDALPSPDLAVHLDLALQAGNDDYAAKRRGLGLAAPVVRCVPPGTFEAWLRAKGRWGGQNKVPRCRSDRTVGDELADHAHAPRPAAQG